MLYLETPIGVGFSYSTNTSSYEAVDDEITGILISIHEVPLFNSVTSLQVTSLIFLRYITVHLLVLFNKSL